MADLTERVARVEEQSDAHIRAMDYLHRDMSDVRHSMDALRGEMKALGTELRAEMSTLKAELRGDMAALERRFDRMDVRVNWLIGIVVTSSIATVGAVAGAFWGLLQALR